MREILFKGFHPDKNGKEKAFVNDEWVSGEWVYGSQVTHNSKYYIYFEKEDLMCQTGNWLEQVEVIQETVGQYTGLTDKNGKMIFEGDIFKDGFDLISVVEWVEDGRFLGFGINRRPNWDPNGRLITYIAKESNVAVIGNLYENPELLEGETNE